MDQKERVIKSILENKAINKFFDSVKIQKDEFRQFVLLIFLEQCETKFEKINKMWSEGTLPKWVMSIAVNQLKSNSSPYYRLYNQKMIVLKDDMSTTQIEDREERKPDPRHIIRKVIGELDKIHPGEAVVFKMYIGINPMTNEITEPMSYNEINKAIDINYHTARHIVLKIKSRINKILKDDLH